MKKLSIVLGALSIFAVTSAEAGTIHCPIPSDLTTMAKQMARFDFVVNTCSNASYTFDNQGQTWHLTKAVSVPDICAAIWDGKIAFTQYAQLIHSPSAPASFDRFDCFYKVTDPNSRYNNSPFNISIPKKTTLSGIPFPATSWEQDGTQSNCTAADPTLCAIDTRS